MKTIFLLLFAAFASFNAYASSAEPQNDAEAVYTKYIVAWKEKDLSALDALIASDYMTVNGDNKVASKAMELDEAKTSPTFNRMDIDEIHSVVVANAAVVSGIITYSGTSSAGKSFSGRVRFIGTLVKRHGHWQLLADQSAPAKK